MKAVDTSGEDRYGLAWDAYVSIGDNVRIELEGNDGMTAGHSYSPEEARAVSAALLWLADKVESRATPTTEGAE